MNLSQRDKPLSEDDVLVSMHDLYAPMAAIINVAIELITHV